MKRLFEDIGDLLIVAFAACWVWVFPAIGLLWLLGWLK